MRLDRNSWHVRLNRFVYGQDVTLNPNLCPYFWKTVAAVPLALLAVLGVLIRRGVHSYQRKSGYTERSLAFQKYDRWDDRIVGEDSNLSVGFYSAGAVILAVVALLVVGFMLYSMFMAPSSILVLLGVAVVAAVVVGIWHSAELWWPMIYSAYKGVCPSVEWVDSSVVEEAECTDTECEDTECCDEAPVPTELDDAGDTPTDTGEE